MNCPYRELAITVMTRTQSARRVGIAMMDNGTTVISHNIAKYSQHQPRWDSLPSEGSPGLSSRLQHSVERTEPPVPPCRSRQAITSGN